MAEKLSKKDLNNLDTIVWKYIKYRRKEGCGDFSYESDMAFKLKWKLDKIISEEK